jgi:DNA polymerase/3'-5' exonuclease PolX
MNERDAVLKRQMGAMWGIGPVLLSRFWSRGCRSRHDVLDQKDCPSRCRIADKHYDAMQHRMPRCEVDVISRLIFQQIRNTYKGGEFKCEVVGSFRRGRYDSGDIDCLLSPHDHKMNSSMLPDIVDVLEGQGLAFDHLQLPNRNREWVGKNTYMGFTRLPPLATSIKFEAIDGSGAVGDAVLYVSSDRRELLVSICTKELSSSIKGASLFALDSCGRKQQIIFIAAHKFQNGHVSVQTYPDERIMELLKPNSSCSLAICTELHAIGELTSEFKVGCSLLVTRRLDIKVYPPEQYPTALLYFTGSAHFNRSMRSFADQSGFLLNDYGLFKRLVDSSRIRAQHDRSPHGDQIRCLNERDVFTHLKLTWVEPERRHDQGDVVAFK